MASPSRIITARPLTRENFAAFGDVIDTEGGLHYPINGGMTERFHALARAEAAGPDGHVLINIFQGQPYRFPADAAHGRAPSARQPGLHAAVAAAVPRRRLP